MHLYKISYWLLLLFYMFVISPSKSQLSSSSTSSSTIWQSVGRWWTIGIYWSCAEFQFNCFLLAPHEQEEEVELQNWDRVTKNRIECPFRSTNSITGRSSLRFPSDVCIYCTLEIQLSADENYNHNLMSKILCKWQDLTVEEGIWRRTEIKEDIFELPMRDWIHLLSQSVRWLNWIFQGCHEICTEN